MNMNACNEVEQKHKVFVPNGSMSMDMTPSSVTVSTTSTTPMLSEPIQNGLSLPRMATTLGNLEANQLGSLMEKLRAKTAGVGKTWSDLAKVIRNSSIDKRLAMDMSEKCQLQKCLDSIQKSIKVTSLQSMVERLESITRQQGLKFTAGPSGMDCFISSDMFYVEVLLDNTGEVKDVKIAHHGDPVSCPELTKVLSASDFSEFNSHLEGLAEIYQLNADKKQKTKAFLALQALETDLSMLAQFQCSINDPNNVVHKSPVGILQPRKGGHAMKLTYFISPYDLIDASTKTCIPLSIETVMEKKLGHSVTVSIESSTAHKLQTASLIIVKNQDGKNLPTFAAHTNLNSTTLPASFVLRLKKPIAMATGMVKSIKAVTNIEFVDTSASVPLLSLIVQQQLKQQNPSNSFSTNKNNAESRITASSRSIEDGLSVVLPDQLHCYHFSGWEDLKGVLVESISFTHPTAVPQILVFLRQQTLFNTLLASCVRPATSTSNSSSRTKIMSNASTNGLMTATNDQSVGVCAEDPLKFEVQTLSMSHIVVSFEHPLEESLATVDLDLKDITNVKCKIYTLGTDSLLCTDEYASKVIQRCLSIPVTMRALIRKGQAQKNQHSRMNGSSDQFFSPESSGGPNIIPNGRPPGSSGMSGGGGPNENSGSGISYLSHLPGYGRNRSGMDNSDRPKDDSMEDDIEMDELEDDELEDESSGKEDEERSEGSGASRNISGLSTISQQQCRETELSQVSTSAAENNPILDSLLSPQFQGPGKANTMLMSMLRDVPAANTLPANNFPFLANKNAASKAASNTTSSVPPSPTSLSNVPVASRSASLDSIIGPTTASPTTATKKQKKKKEHKDKVLSQSAKPKKSSSSGFNLTVEMKSVGSLESQPAKSTEFHTTETKISKSFSSSDIHAGSNKSNSVENLSSEAKTSNISMEFNWPSIERSPGRKLSLSGPSSTQQCKRVSKRNRSESSETSRMTESEESCSEEISLMTASLSNESDPARLQTPDSNRKSSPLVLPSKTESPRASPHAGLVSPTSTVASRNQGIVKIPKSQDNASKSESSKTKSSKSVDQAAFVPNTSSKKKDGKREKKRRRVDNTDCTSLNLGANCGSEDKQVKPLHINLSLDSSLMPPPPLGGEARSATCSSPTDTMTKPPPPKSPNPNKKNQINENISSNLSSTKGQNKSSSGINVKYKTGSGKSSSGGGSSTSSVKLKHLNLGLPASTTITPVLPSPIKGNHISPPTTPGLSSPTTGASISIIPSTPCDNLVSGSAMMSNAQSVRNTARASRKNSLKDVIDKLRGGPIPPGPIVSPVSGSHHAHHLSPNQPSSTPTNLTTGLANRTERKESVVSSSSSSPATKSGESKSKYSSSDQFTIKQSSGIKLTVTKTRPTTLSETKLQSSKTKTSNVNASSQKQTTNAQYPTTKKSSQEGKSQSSKIASEGKSKQISQVMKNNRSSPNSSIKSLSNSNKVKPLQQLHSLATPKFPLTNQNILSSLNTSGIQEMGALDLVSTLSNESKNSNFQHLLHPPISNSDSFVEKPVVTNTALTMMPELDLSKTDFSKQGLFGKSLNEKDSFTSAVGASDTEQLLVPTNLSRMATEKVSSSSDNVSKNNSEFEAIQMELRRSATPQTLDLSDKKDTSVSSAPVVSSCEEPSSSFNPALKMDQMTTPVNLQGQEMMTNAIQHKEKLSILTPEKHSKPEKMIAHNLCMKLEEKDDLDKSPEEEGLVIDYHPGESGFSSNNNPSSQTTTPVTSSAVALGSQIEKPQSEVNVASPVTTSSKSPFQIAPVTTKSPAPVGTPPSNHSISSSMSRPSPCVIDDDLMDEAVMGLGD